MSANVLFVDDEPNVLEGIRRQLRKELSIETATSGEDGLQKIRDSGPFAVVISDMRMPGMNGSRFLSEVRKNSPDSVRMILSGQAELESTIEAVNEGHIFRFLTKPCSTEALLSAVNAGLEQNRLVLAERQLLEQTLSGAVKMLTEVLEIANPAAFSRASRIQRYAMDIARAVGREGGWQFRLATMLSQIGCITLPEEALARKYTGQEISDDEQALFNSHPDVARNLLAKIPRFEEVAEIIAGQMQTFDIDSMPEDVLDWDSKSMGSIILQVAAAFDDLIGQGVPAAKAIHELGSRERSYPEQLREALRSIRIVTDEVETRLVKLSQLEIGMVMDEDLMSANNMRLIPSGQEVTQTILVRLRSIANGVGISEPFRVKVMRWATTVPQLRIAKTKRGVKQDDE